MRVSRRTDAFPTKFHGGSIAHFRGSWFVVRDSWGRGSCVGPVDKGVKTGQTSFDTFPCSLDSVVAGEAVGEERVFLFRAAADVVDYERDVLRRTLVADDHDVREFAWSA